MNYIVHVVDDASQFEKKSDTFKLVIGKGVNEECQILRSDAFYNIEADSPIDAVTKISDIIKVKVEDDVLTLKEAFLKTKQEIRTSDFSENIPDFLLHDTNLKIKSNPYGEAFDPSCQIRKAENGEVWYELHHVYFYIVEQSKIMKISK